MATGTFEVRSPIDRDVLVGTFAKGTGADVERAIAAARRAAPAWAATPWQDRLAILRRAAELISERQMALRRRHGDRGRQEPAGGARRGRGSRPT